jgi:hypothetical protein
MVRVDVSLARRQGLLTQITEWFKAVTARPEPVDLIEQRFNFLPYAFRRRGAVRRVRTIVKIWDHGRIGRRPPRRYFHITCQGGDGYVLFQDLHMGTWHLSSGGM